MAPLHRRRAALTNAVLPLSHCRCAGGARRLARLEGRDAAAARLALAEAVDPRDGGGAPIGCMHRLADRRRHILAAAAEHRDHHEEVAAIASARAELARGEHRLTVVARGETDPAVEALHLPSSYTHHEVHFRGFAIQEAS